MKLTIVGTLFRLDPDLTLHRMVEGTTIGNGMSWTADDRTFYFTDTPTKTIFAYDFHVETGEISNKRVHFRVPDDWKCAPGKRFYFPR